MRDDLNSIMRNKFILEYISEIETNQLKRIQKDLIDDIHNNTFSDNFGEVLEAVTKELEKRNNEYNKPQEHVSSQQIQPQGHVFSPKPTDQNSLKGSSDASTLQEDLKELYLGKKSPDVSISQEDLKQLNLDKKSYENIIKKYKDMIEEIRSDTDITDEIKIKLIANEWRKISECEQKLNDIEEKINVSNKKDRQFDAPFGNAFSAGIKKEELLQPINLAHLGIASGDGIKKEKPSQPNGFDVLGLEKIDTTGLGKSSDDKQSDGEKSSKDRQSDAPFGFAFSDGIKKEKSSQPNGFDVLGLEKIDTTGLGKSSDDKQSDGEKSSKDKQSDGEKSSNDKQSDGEKSSNDKQSDGEKSSNSEQPPMGEAEVISVDPPEQSLWQKIKSNKIIEKAIGFLLLIATAWHTGKLVKATNDKDNDKVSIVKEVNNKEEYGEEKDNDKTKNNSSESQENTQITPSDPTSYSGPSDSVETVTPVDSTQQEETNVPLQPIQPQEPVSPTEPTNQSPTEEQNPFIGEPPLPTADTPDEKPVDNPIDETPVEKGSEVIANLEDGESVNDGKNEVVNNDSDTKPVTRSDLENSNNPVKPEHSDENVPNGDTNGSTIGTDITEMEVSEAEKDNILDALNGNIPDIGDIEDGPGIDITQEEYDALIKDLEKDAPGNSLGR